MLFQRLRSDRSSRLASPWELQHRGGAVSKPYMSKVNYDDIAEASWTLLESNRRPVRRLHFTQGRCHQIAQAGTGTSGEAS
jgi:hypothetical protein